MLVEAIPRHHRMSILWGMKTYGKESLVNSNFFMPDYLKRIRSRLLFTPRRDDPDHRPSRDMV